MTSASHAEGRQFDPGQVYLFSFGSASLAQLVEHALRKRKVAGSIPAGGFSSKNSATGTRTRVARVRAEYPNQLDYSGFCHTVEKQT